MGRLSTHVLDTALTGETPAGGVAIRLSRIDGDGQAAPRFSRRAPMPTGAPDSPRFSPDDAFVCGRYELTFAIGDYFRAQGLSLPEPAFLDEVPIRFGIAEARRAITTCRCSPRPWGCTTYRGS